MGAEQVHVPGTLSTYATVVRDAFGNGIGVGNSTGTFIPASQMPQSK